MTATMLPRRIALLAAIALLPIFAACGKDDDPAGPENISGTFVMRTVDGKPLPVTLFEYVDAEESYKYEVLGGNIVLEQNGGFRENATFRETIDGVSEEHDAPTSGTWTRDGNSVTLQGSDGFTKIASFGGGALTLNQGPYLVRYSR